ncbi:Flavin reductase-like, FMN-binding protein [Trichormus variabilis ATCC 29413]|uniref:Flavin reductase-like, FMN-binding protein n=2 Tax=Anabaena variabilis TaxID=264691 RepID=Q3MDE1_TRIV2|nr:MULTISPECIES: diflavin flavoprotein [Nostocaceae]ABA20995.1 Flavin reductase-like, FMN-binding protein [Trichormus variabilis ATCC 29413]MBC1214145.1 diflavin flavoprotein [Trichormus variabilis ARAD]MBC1257183.1 diflavin flavoprotein [Trichormus variabilis V5]MBC1270339.1 diflavin flavoprotein [Trichormus variabilis FSR]MBC1300682.1 diflavin flavoprotein [Trichormus variabilis N2B]
MVALTEDTQANANRGRLTVQTVEIAAETTAIRCLDWDRERFDIEFGLRNGTTYNSFLIQGEKIALVDTSHRKFEKLYLEIVAGLIDPNTIDYLIISHTEPDHSGLVKDILQLAPSITIVGAKVAIQFLENMVHQPFKSLQVKSGERLDLGNGHNLEFVSAPNLHWPDTILTYDHKTGILYTCDVFGMHYCDDQTYDENFFAIEEDFKYYYDCLMGPNARSVLAALKRIENLTINTVATGHGPLLQNHISEWLGKYQNWSLEQAKTETLVALFYAEDYGYSEHLVHTLGHGCTKTGVAVELIDLNTAEPQEVRELVAQASGLVIAMPSQYSLTAQAALNTILAAVHHKQAIGLLESGGGEDEPVFPLRNKFQELGLVEAFPPILIKEAPTQTTEQLCEEAGTDIGQWLTRDRTIKQIKSINTDLEKALGRISTGLYIITTKKGEIQGAMFASWVTQASLNPLGVAIAVSKERAIESLMHVGDRFVLNVLEEDNYQGLMKHFLKRFAPGADRFAGIKTYPATDGSPILAESLAYTECEITSRIDCGDHWIIYSTVQVGRVANVHAMTAVHHRKVGNHY